jgi:hypothetical protein
MAFIVTPHPPDAGGNPRSGVRTRRRRHNGVVIFLKTSPWLSREGPIGQLEFGGNDALLVLAAALGLCLRGAMYGMASHLARRLLRVSQDPASFSPISRHMRGGTLVWVALESRSCYGVSCFVRDAVLKPCAPLLATYGRMLSKAGRLSSGL